MTVRNVGLVGLGKITQIIYLPYLLRLSEQYAVVALCDRDTALLAQVMALYPHTRGYTSLAQMIEAESNTLDAIFVLTSGNHAPLVLQALDGGYHVYVEKPLALTEAATRQIAARSHEASKMVMVGYMKRYDPVIDLLKQSKDEWFGSPRFMHVETFAGGQHRRDRLYRTFPSKGASQDDDFLISEELQTNDPLQILAYKTFMYLGAHNLNLCRHLLGHQLKVEAVKCSRINELVQTSALFTAGDTFITMSILPDFKSWVDWTDSIRWYSERVAGTLNYRSPFVRDQGTTLHLNMPGSVSRDVIVRPGHLDGFIGELRASYRVLEDWEVPETDPMDFIEDCKLIREATKAI